MLVRHMAEQLVQIPPLSPTARGSFVFQKGSEGLAVPVSPAVTPVLPHEQAHWALQVPGPSPVLLRSQPA